MVSWCPVCVCVCVNGTRRSSPTYSGSSTFGRFGLLPSSHPAKYLSGSAGFALTSSVSPLISVGLIFVLIKSLVSSGEGSGSTMPAMQCTLVYRVISQRNGQQQIGASLQHSRTRYRRNRAKGECTINKYFVFHFHFTYSLGRRIGSHAVQHVASQSRARRSSG